MPILWGENFIGRLDPKAERKDKKLIIRTLLFENDFSQYEKLLPVLARKLKEMAGFNDCHEVVIQKVKPSKIIKSLQKLLR
jgi:uncharacterized protein YcaQ